MIHSQIDHLAVTAPSLEAGVDYVRRALGVPLQVGGEHPRMGTHNYVLKLGEKVYLEVISINPAASAPDRPRWFDLDAPDPFRVPRLATWIVRTNDIQEAVSRSPIVSGHIEPMGRGDLNWKITIPKDGSLPLGGVVPTLIQWQDVHPAEALQDFGCRLLRLEGFHPEAERVNEVLATIGFQGEFSVTPLAPGARPYLVAQIQTPTGERKIGSS